MIDSPRILEKRTRNQIKGYPDYHNSILNAVKGNSNSYSMQKAFNFIFLTNSKMKGLEGIDKKTLLNFLKNELRNESRVLDFNIINTYRKQALKIIKANVIHIEKLSSCGKCEVSLKQTMYSLVYL